MAKTKKYLKGIGIFLLVFMGLILGILLFFTLREYRPKPIETTDTPSGKKRFLWKILLEFLPATLVTEVWMPPKISSWTEEVGYSRITRSR